MKKGFKYFIVFVILITVFYGLKTRFGITVEKYKNKNSKSVTNRHLNERFSVREDRNIVTILIGDHVDDNIDRAIESLSRQKYRYHRIICIDNASQSPTFENFADKHHHIDCIRYSSRKPILEILYSLISELNPNDVVTLMGVNDWLLHENVFDHLNISYANPNVWMTCSRFIIHPEYKYIHDVHQQLGFLTERSSSRGIKDLQFVSFYAGLFHSIKLEDLLKEGAFIDYGYQYATLLPMLEMADQHILYQDSVDYVTNTYKTRIKDQSQWEGEVALQQQLSVATPYYRSDYIHGAQNIAGLRRYTSDVVIFSDDHPLHLYACLESIISQARDINDIYVLYKGSDAGFQRAYLNVQNEFHGVKFLNVSDFPDCDYLSMLHQVLDSGLDSSPYLVLVDDHILLSHQLHLHDHIAVMENVHTNYCSLMGNIDNTQAIAIKDGIVAYQKGDSLLSKDQVFHLMLCRKSKIQSVKAASNTNQLYEAIEAQLTARSLMLASTCQYTTSVSCVTTESPIDRKRWSSQLIEGYKIDTMSLTAELETDATKMELPVIKRDHYHMSQKHR